MSLDGVCFDRLTSLLVGFRGGLTIGRTRDWCGTLDCTEPIVGITFLTTVDIVEWCKSERRIENSLEVRLSLSPYDDALRDVQINFSVGRGGCRWRSVVESPKYFPIVPQFKTLRTGMIENIATVEGDPNVELFVLPIARRDVKTARNGLWRVRDELVSTAPDSYARILTYGRTGKFAAEVISPVALQEP